MTELIAINSPEFELVSRADSPLDLAIASWLHAKSSRSGSTHGTHLRRDDGRLLGTAGAGWVRTSAWPITSLSSPRCGPSVIRWRRAPTITGSPPCRASIHTTKHGLLSGNLIDLAERHRPAAVVASSAPAERKITKAERVRPLFNGDGSPMCPVHRKPLTPGRFGLYCQSKAAPGDKQNDRGYCALKFEE